MFVPVKSGRSKSEIKNHAAQDGGQLITFGSKAKVIEGESGPRPFKNPAMKSTKARRRARNRKALKTALRKAT